MLPHNLLTVSEAGSRIGAEFLIVPDAETLCNSEYCSSRALCWYLGRHGLKVVPVSGGFTLDPIEKHIRNLNIYYGRLPLPRRRANTANAPVRFSARKGRAAFGYRFSNGGTEIDETEGMIIKRVFELTAEGVSPTGIVDKLAAEFPGLQIPARNRIPLIAGNKRYAGIADSLQNDYPAIVSPALFFAANAKDIKDDEHIFILNNVMLPDRRMLMPQYEKKGLRRPIYADTEEEISLDAEIFEQLVLNAVFDKLKQTAGKLCEDIKSFSVNEKAALYESSEAAAKRVTEIDAETEAAKTDIGRPTRDNLRRLDALRSARKLNEIEISFLQYRAALLSLNSEEIDTYCEKLSMLKHLTRREQAYHLNALISKIVIVDMEAHVFVLAERPEKFKIPIDRAILYSCR